MPHSPTKGARRRSMAPAAAAAAWVALLLSTPATWAAAAGSLALRVTSSVGRVIETGSCQPSSSGNHVVADGSVARPVGRSLIVTLDVYSAEGSPLDLEGADQSSTLSPGATRWRVTATIVRGFAPTRCVVHVAATEHLERIRVGGSSMTPTIMKGSSVLVDLSAYTSAKPKTGDLVAIRRPSAACAGPHQSVLVLRVVALGGQSVEGVQGNILVDGRTLAEPWLAKGSSSRTPSFAPVGVAAGDYFLLGDDRTQACDSRDFGAVPGTDILGKVVKVLGTELGTVSPSTYSGTGVTPGFTT